MKEINIGDTIRDVEDGDCYYEGVVVSTDPLKYRVTKAVWHGEIDNSMNGKVIEQEWWFIEHA